MASERETLHALLMAAKVVTQRINHRLRGTGVTMTQLNALRILRGAKPDALPCGEIADRMMHPVPDITRLVDRLEKRGWVERHRDTVDRRVVRIKIIQGGLRMLQRLDGAVEEMNRELMGHLSRNERSTLVKLLGRVCEKPD
jgi:DNA-binding MarR family transcriptional regulator